MATHSSVLAWRLQDCLVHGITKSRTRLSSVPFHCELACPTAAPVLGPPRSAPQPGDWASTLPVGLEDPGLPRDPLWPQPTRDLRLRPLGCARPLPAAPCGSLSLLQPDLVCWLAGCRSPESRPLSLCELEGAASLLWGVISGSGPRWKRGLGRLGWAEEPDPLSPSHSAPSPSSWRPGIGTTIPPRMVSQPLRVPGGLPTGPPSSRRRA